MIERTTAANRKLVKPVHIFYPDFFLFYQSFINEYFDNVINGSPAYRVDLFSREPDYLRILEFRTVANRIDNG